MEVSPNSAWRISQPKKGAVAQVKVGNEARWMGQCTVGEIGSGGKRPVPDLFLSKKAINTFACNHPFLFKINCLLFIEKGCAIFAQMKVEVLVI